MGDEQSRDTQEAGASGDDPPGGSPQPGGDAGLDISDAGIFAKHPARTTLPVLVAPSVEDEFNTIRPDLITVACAQLPDHHFEFDSSFITPTAAGAFTRLAALVKAHPGCPLSVFGHADPVGQDEYNKKLSGRRAAAVYALLTRRVDIWEDIYSNKGQWTDPAAGDRWGTRAIQVMLNTVGYPPGKIDGAMGPDTGDAVEAFQRDHGLNPDRDPGPLTRGQLFPKYMDTICRDGAGQPFRCEKTDFLGRGADEWGKVDYQGCSEFNPVLVFSQEKHQELSKPANKEQRDAANAPNRRVIVYLFQKGSQVAPSVWPCPRAKEGTGDCKKRFWSDGEERRTSRLPEEDREFKKSEDTFACRFYHGLAAFSPCEKPLEVWILRILQPGHGSIEDRKPVADTPYKVVVGDTRDAPVTEGATTKNGLLRIPVFDDKTKMTLEIEGMRFTLNGGDLLDINAGDEAVKQRLHSLGYSPLKFGHWSEWGQETFTNATKKFQADEGDLPQTGTVDAATRDRIKTRHGS